MAHYYCLFLDLDGTMLDFEAAESGAIKETFEKFNIPYNNENVEKYKTINKKLWASFEKGEIKQESLVVKRFERLLNELNLKGNAVQINNFYLTSLSTSADLYDGVIDTLKELADVATLVIITNGVARVQKPKLEKSGIINYIDEVIISESVGVSKPSRKIFDIAIKKLDIENRKRVLMVGDSLKADIQGAKNANIDSCWCNFNNVDLPEDAAKPTHTIFHFEELLKIVMEDEELQNVGSKQKRHQISLDK